MENRHFKDTIGAERSRLLELYLACIKKGLINKRYMMMYTIQYFNKISYMFPPNKLYIGNVYYVY